MPAATERAYHGMGVGPDLDRAGWLEARREGVSASESSVVLGLYPGQSALALYEEKRNGRVDEDHEPDDRPEYFRHGLGLEPYVWSLLQEETGIAGERAQELLQSRAWPWMLATPDYISEDGCPVEVKTTGTLGNWDNGCPPWIWCQLQHQMAVMGAETSFVGLFAGGYQGLAFRHTEVVRDSEFIDKTLVPAAANFMGCVRHGLLPKADDTAACRDALARLFPVATPETIALPASFIEADESLQEIKTKQKQMATKRLAIENQIKAAMGDAEYAALPSGAIYSWRNQTTNRKAAEAKTTVSRVLRRKEPKA